MGGFFQKITKPGADLRAVASVDPVFAKGTKPLLDAENTFRDRIMKSPAEPASTYVSPLNEINTPSLKKKPGTGMQTGARTSGLAAKTLLG